jgi:hypothetical protein
MPKVSKKIPTNRITKPGSLNGFAINALVIVLGLGGCLEVTVKMAMINNPKIKNAPARMAHPYPVVRISRVIMMGNMMPPRLLPVERIPYAAPRFLLNQPAMQFMPGWKMQATPMALQTPCERRNW